MKLIFLLLFSNSAAHAQILNCKYPNSVSEQTKQLFHLISIKGPTDDRISPERFIQENPDIDLKSIKNAVAAQGEIICFQHPVSKSILNQHRRNDRRYTLWTKTNAPVAVGNAVLYWANNIAVAAAHEVVVFNKTKDPKSCVFMASNAKGQKVFYGIKALKVGTTDPDHDINHDWAVVVLDQSVKGVQPMAPAQEKIKVGDQIVVVSAITSNRANHQDNSAPTITRCQADIVTSDAQVDSFAYAGNACDDGMGSSGSAAYSIKDGKLMLKGILEGGAGKDYAPIGDGHPTTFTALGQDAQNAADQFTEEYK